MTRPVIICAPVRNELHNLSRILPAWSLYADHIVVADQGSWDGTRELLAAHPKVTLLDNRDIEFHERNRILLLLDKARAISHTAILLFLDADETLSANVMSSLEWNRFARAVPGTTGFFNWIQLFGSIKHYISATASYPFAYVDDGRPFTEGSVMHGPRGPGFYRPTRIFRFNDVVNLHFFLTNQNIYRKKQNWYKLYWHKRGGKYFHINRNHTVYDTTTIADCAPTPSIWYEGFEQEGIDLVSVESPTLTWYDVEILQHMHCKGSRLLWLLDIWNQDWEQLRELAIAAGHTGVPQKPITLPPRHFRAYNDLTLGRISWKETVRAGGRLLKRKILP
jgi:Glycosyl transferase family 2